MANYTFYPDAKFTVLTFQEFFALSKQERAMLSTYAQTGNADYLAMASPALCAQFQAWVGAGFETIAVQLERLGATQALGTIKSYPVFYAQLGADKNLISFSTHNITPRPTSAEQLDVFKTGVPTSYEKDWILSAIGIVLAEPLVAGEYLTIRVLSPEFAAAKHRFDFTASVGTGSGNRVWKLDDLPADDHGNTIANFPASPGKLEVYRGLLQTSAGASPDYAITGTGQDTQVTFTYDLPADATVNFIVWDV